ncbi:MAG: class II aldolase and adducin N-terminal domain-containing protein [Campylobacterota bacterium]|nr:class II aldolase and adducin N-terminal domain-containing protein [Campylobacterota bacterium]
MIENTIVKHLSDISLALFRKNFFGIYHGSISKKIDHDNFIINTKGAIFDEIEGSSLCELTMNKYDYTWQIASIEANTHNSIYNQIHEAKYITCGMPPYTTAYSLEYDSIEFEDYFGKLVFDKIDVYDPGDFSSWERRAPLEIPRELKKTLNHLIIVKGVGVYVYDRDMNELVKKVAILENSCRLLALKSQIKNIKDKKC